MNSFKTIGLSFTIVASALSLKAQSLQDGVKAYEVEQYGKAARIFKNLIKTNPAAAETYYYLGQVYLETDKLDSAKQTFNKGIAANAQNQLNYIGLGQVNLEQESGIEAKKNFDKALSLTNPKDPKTLIAIGDAYINSEKSKNATQAVTYITQAVEIDKKNPVAYLSLGDAYLEQGNGGAAANNYEKAIEINKMYTKAYLRKGQLFSRARNYNEALTSYQGGLKIDSTYSPLYRDLAELYYQFRKYDLATATYKKYIQVSEDNVKTKTRYVNFLYQNKDYAQIVQIVNEVSKTDSSNVSIKRFMGYSLYEQKQYEQGLRYMQKFLAKADKKKVIALDYEYYGKLLSKNNQDSAAILNFKKAMEMEPKPELNGEIGDVFFKDKNYLEAAKYYELKVNTNKKPSNLDYFSLAKSYYYGADYVKADTVFSKLSSLQPAWVQGYVWIARSRDLMDKEPKAFTAKPLFEKTIELGAVDATKNKKELLDAYKYLGVYSIQKDDKANTKLYFSKILELDPENAEAKKVMSQLK
jgi:tetratricopeptide (TPR) repeat protein